MAVLDTEIGHRFAHRGNQRFLMCSTFKLLLVAAVLARVDHGKERLEQRDDKAVKAPSTPTYSARTLSLARAPSEFVQHLRRRGAMLKVSDGFPMT